MRNTSLTGMSRGEVWTRFRLVYPYTVSQDSEVDALSKRASSLVG